VGEEDDKDINQRAIKGGSRGEYREDEEGGPP